MTQATYKDYWVASNAISISLNAMGNPDYAQVSVSSGASIICYMKNVEGLGYDAGHNYRRWQLQAVPTAFGTTGVKYVYVAIPRNEDSKPALVVFPSEIIDIYGKNALETQIGNADYFYINLGGVISASVVDGENKNRTFSTNINTGRLSTDEALNAAAEDAEWYEYSTVTSIVTFTKDIMLKAGVKFLNILADIVETAKLKLGGTEVDGIADANTPVDSTTKLVTPAWIGGEYLSKKNDDEAQGSIKFHKDIEVLQGVTAGGTSKMYDLRIQNGIQSDELMNGLSGWQINKFGDAAMKSLRLSEFLEVPELRYNRASVYTGVQWQTFGAGIIEEVYPDGPTSKNGYCKLKLEKGEIGAIAQNDICMGIYHEEVADGEADTNDTVDSDGKNGNFTFAGFQTIYFRIDKMVDAEGNDIQDSSNNQYFRYTLRSAVDFNYSKSIHPKVGMHFACYANTSNSSRQSCEYSTTKYRVQLVNMTNWTYDGHNIALIIGQLSGFTIPASRINANNEWEDYNYQLSGSGIGFGNAYMWGQMTELNRRDYLLSQQLYYHISDVDPQIFLASSDWMQNDWRSDTISPNRTKPFLYTYWRKEYASGKYETEGPYLAGSDSSVYEVRLSKNVLSMAISNWYDEDDPETIHFVVDANLLCGNITSVIDTATAVSAFENMTYTVEISEDNKTAHFDCTIEGYIPQEVAGIAPEDNYVTFKLVNEYGEASKTMTIVETKQGEDGSPGSDGFSVFTSYVFKRSSTPLTADDTPEGGDFDGPFPDDTDWSDSIPAGTDLIYMSSRVFTSTGEYPQQEEWSVPVLMADSAEIDFCYSSEEEKPNENTLPAHGSNTDNDTWHNEASEDDIWMAVSTLSHGQWSDWQINKIKGEKGDEGVSVITSYVFRRSSTALTSSDTPEGGTFESPLPTGTDWSGSVPSGTAAVYMSQRRFASEEDSPLNQASWTTPVLLADSPDMDVCYASTTYKPDESTLPGKGSNEENSTWHNTATDEDIWMAMCTKTNGSWGNWQITKFKGEKGDDGVAVFTSYVFRRSSTPLVDSDKPTGGTFNSPNPEERFWSDGIPAGTDSIYMSQRRFASKTGSSLNQTSWTTPVLLADSPDMDICYSSNKTKPQISTLPTKGSNTDNDTWHNTASEDDIWMAMCSKTNGSWGDWQISKIKGEDGISPVVYDLVPNASYIKEGTSPTLNATIVKTEEGSSTILSTIPSGYYLYRKIDSGMWSKITSLSNIEYSTATVSISIGLSAKNNETSGLDSGFAGTGSIGTGVVKPTTIYDADMISLKSIPIINQGSKGLDGCVIRMMGEWNKDTIYVNESTSTSEGIRYIDIVQYKDSNGELKYYQRNTVTNQYVQTTDNGVAHYPYPTDSTFWQAANMFKFIATDVLIAKEAWADILQGTKFYATDNAGNVTAGLQTVSASNAATIPQIFAGASQNNAEDAPFRVFSDGSAFANDIEVNGELRAKSYTYEESQWVPVQDYNGPSVLSVAATPGDLLGTTPTAGTFAGQKIKRNTLLGSVLRLESKKNALGGANGTKCIPFSWENKYKEFTITSLNSGTLINGGGVIYALRQINNSIGEKVGVTTAGMQIGRLSDTFLVRGNYGSYSDDNEYNNDSYTRGIVIHSCNLYLGRNNVIKVMSIPQPNYDYDGEGFVGSEYDEDAEEDGSFNHRCFKWVITSALNVFWMETHGVGMNRKAYRVTPDGVITEVSQMGA